MKKVSGIGIHHVCIVLVSLMVTLTLRSQAQYVPTDNILLNCGAPGETTDFDGRKWTTDINSKFAPREDNTVTDTAASQDPSVPQIPYLTARVFNSEFTYSFPVGPGRKAVRLYFYPAKYNGRNASGAVFDVISGEFTLMRNFKSGST